MFGTKKIKAREENIMINVAVLGYGTVGSGVVEVIEKNKDMVNKKSAQELEVNTSWI